MEEKKKLIEELKQIMLDMYRNAANLDSFIQCLENPMMTNSGNLEYDKMYVDSQYMHRRYQKSVLDYDRLDERENSVWERIIMEYKKEQES